MKIAVCDDEQVVLNKISGIFEDYIEANNAELDYSIFESYEDLCSQMDEFDLFILDYMMPGMNGMDFARKLREESDRNSGIIFLTAYSDFVYEAFEVRAYRFITKPIDEYKLIKAINDFANDTKEYGKLTVKCDDGLRTVKIDDIYYIEAQIKHTVIHLKEGKTLVSRITMTSFEQEIDCELLFRIHRSFIVNCDKVQRIQGLECILENGETLPIGKKKFSDFKKHYIQIIKSR